MFYWHNIDRLIYLFICLGINLDWQHWAWFYVAWRGCICNDNLFVDLRLLYDKYNLLATSDDIDNQH